ncbi:MAG: YdbL family protein [Marinicellaceae bacterium]
MKSYKLTLLSSVFLFTAACVTINVYFPAAEAEEAAEKIINKIIGEGDEQTETGSNPQSFNFNPLNWFISTAHAEVNINISSPAIVEITDRMEARFSNQLKTHIDAGTVGFTNEGFIDIIDASALGLRDRQIVKKTVADDNRDRKALYRELAVANGHADWEDSIRNVFVKLWREKARSGWKYQDADGVWQTK